MSHASPRQWQRRRWPTSQGRGWMRAAFGFLVGAAMINLMVALTEMVGSAESVTDLSAARHACSGLLTPRYCVYGGAYSAGLQRPDDGAPGETSTGSWRRCSAERSCGRGGARRRLLGGLGPARRSRSDRNDAGIRHVRHRALVGDRQGRSAFVTARASAGALLGRDPLW
jgi:hypothetical protein